MRVNGPYVGAKHKGHEFQLSLQLICLCLHELHQLYSWHQMSKVLKKMEEQLCFPCHTCLPLALQMEIASAQHNGMEIESTNAAIYNLCWPGTDFN